MNDLLLDIIKNALRATWTSQPFPLRWIPTELGFRSQELEGGIVIELRKDPNNTVPHAVLTGRNWRESLPIHDAVVTELWGNLEGSSQYYAEITDDDLKAVLWDVKRRHEPY